jgi:DNA-binding transcriptional MerR regulator/methylmalonyl-CoA mutase cobalamin-binding subunit
MYTIKEASVRSGVGVPLLRAWERRYGVVRPTRTGSGYRLYDDAAIDRLRAMRRLIGDGWSAQQAAEHIRARSDEELAALARPLAGSAAEDGVVSGEDVDAAAGLVDRLVEAARDIDAPTFEAALDEAFGSGRFEVVAERVIMPALRAIGDAWERGVLTVAAEHAASHAVLRRLAMAYEAAAEAGSDAPVLVGLGPGSRHELGALAFAIAARRAGMNVLYLGPDLPADSWVEAAVGRGARAAAIGVPMRADIRRAGEVIEALRAARPELVLAVGGDEAERAARASGVLALSGELSEAVATLRAAVAGTSRSSASG